MSEQTIFNISTEIHNQHLQVRLNDRSIFCCYQRCKTDPPQRLKIDPGVNLLL